MLGNLRQLGFALRWCLNNVSQRSGYRQSLSTWTGPVSFHVKYHSPRITPTLERGIVNLRAHYE